MFSIGSALVHGAKLPAGFGVLASYLRYQVDYAVFQAQVARQGHVLARLVNDKVLCILLR